MKLMQNLSGFASFAPDHEGDAVAEMRGLAPADIAMGRRCRVEGHYRISGGASVVSDDAVFLVQRPLQLPDHSVGVYRHLV